MSSNSVIIKRFKHLSLVYEIQHPLCFTREMNRISYVREKDMPSSLIIPSSKMTISLATSFGRKIVLFVGC